LRAPGDKLFLLLVLAILGPAKWITAADEGSRRTVEPVFAIASPDSKDIPAGFTVERYARVWERNPFTLTAVAPKMKPSPFDKLFLASWLKDGNKEVALVQDSETNQLQGITAGFNQNHLRLLGIHLDPNPQLVAAILSDGSRQGRVKFRFDASAGRTGSEVPEVLNNSVTRQIPSAPFSQAPPAKPPDSEASGTAAVVAADPSITHRIYPGVARVHIEGSGGQAPRPRKVRGIQPSASPVPQQSNPGRN
jgi:hypothetical protein